MLNQQSTLLPCVDSYIEPLLTSVLKTDKLGICCGTVEVDSVSSSCGRTKGDRFKLSIPYAKQNLVWNVLFDSQCPEMGPDFLFNDNTFLTDMDIDTVSHKIPSLAQWNPNDKNALVNVLIELLSCYKQYQIDLLQKQNRLQIEYNMLIKSTEVKSKDVEIILLPLGSKPTEAKFLISLSIDVSKLPHSMTESRSNVAMLLVTFCGADWNRIIPELVFPKYIEKMLGGANALHLPNFSSDTCLADYVPDVENYIAGRMNLLAESLEKRRSFTAQMLSFLCNKVIEYDTVNHTYITILLQKDDFQCILFVNLSLVFPRERPTCLFQSIYHMTNERTLYSEKVDLPYHPQWSTEKIRDEFISFVEQYIKKFKHNSCSLYP
ncbi:BRISC and BRCA1-A complex member 2 [Calliopsis andreniformis]|uniref:BRISC and BRCA1-A complex member 2 n=1 Tax=Calliopsis andreniformis TaxID=337506 RepID=UPI003FCDE62F